MPSQKFLKLSFAAVMMTAAAAAAGVIDVCNPALPYTMPDHDQVRMGLFNVVGLQNNGTQYCVPTCTMNILTYLQNHGYPALNAGPGPGPWFGNGNTYNAFSTDIESLGGLMSTDPFDGTDGGDAFAGVKEWIDNAGLTGDIVVSMFGTNANGAPEWATSRSAWSPGARSRSASGGTNRSATATSCVTAATA